MNFAQRPRIVGIADRSGSRCRWPRTGRARPARRSRRGPRRSAASARRRCPAPVAGRWARRRAPRPAVPNSSSSALRNRGPTPEISDSRTASASSSAAVAGGRRRHRILRLRRVGSRRQSSTRLDASQSRRSTSSQLSHAARPHIVLVDVADQFDVAHPRGQHEPQLAVLDFLVVGHGGQQRLAIDLREVDRQAQRRQQLRAAAR